MLCFMFFSQNVMFLKFEMTRSSHLSETLKWEKVFMTMFLCKLLCCSVVLIDGFLCLSGSSFGSEIFDTVS